MNDLTAADVCDRAADIIEGHRWTSNPDRLSDECFCIESALCVAAGLDWKAWINLDNVKLAPALNDAVAALKSDLDAYALYAWNDRQERKRPVVRALRRTAAGLRAA